MGQWKTKAERLEYHREFNRKYRKEHPDKISQYKKNGKDKTMKKKKQKESDAVSSHRITVLVDEQDEGFII